MGKVLKDWSSHHKDKSDKCQEAKALASCEKSTFESMKSIVGLLFPLFLYVGCKLKWPAQL